MHKQKVLINFLPPEFRNRLDKIPEFKKLTQDMIIHITNKFLKDLSKQLAEKNIQLRHKSFYRARIYNKVSY